MRPVDLLESDPPRSAVGRVRRLVDGMVTDEADFAYLHPARWRVRHASGREVVSDGPDLWERETAAAEWAHDRAEHGDDVHHTGFLRAMLFPSMLPALTDRASRVTADETLPDGGRRLTVTYHEPVPGTMLVEVTPEGRLRRIEGRDDGRRSVVELTADYAAIPGPEAFDRS
jgi:hypothetical protein